MAEHAAVRREREFEFTQRDFEQIRRLIYEHAGISLSPAKMDMVYSRIARRLRATGLTIFQEYLSFLNENPDEWQHFTNSLTTNLTSFFRESHHFPVLAEHAQDIKRQGRRPMRVWSSACSTGEEPYSIAMTLIEAFDSWTPPVQILATDLDTNVVRHAAEGIYPLDRVEKLSTAQLKRFFLRGTGSRAGMARMRPEVQALIEFQPLNLLSPAWPMREPFDVIFCRNVMIYFDKATQAKILTRFHPLLRPDGLLFVGHSESLAHVANLFRLRGKTVYAPVHPH
ncbi:chemotaxis protein methyltransferase CheR [Allochromatium warmingii]|uniref:Chemotaxis protein methyltransferase n=1 Tax=Allochromatium warmingii TaxID=61595 RepID=A0A1H3DXY1_ALLWA|nr:CheR family methyltransferase [Allochromatium warmingii]SDX71343.1 chemotaxis protein methyltransferase CheR [Allochromatium warmingii]